jgi:hypothetical protein
MGRVGASRSNSNVSFARCVPVNLASKNVDGAPAVAKQASVRRRRRPEIGEAAFAVGSVL